MIEFSFKFGVCPVYNIYDYETDLLSSIFGHKVVDKCNRGELLFATMQAINLLEEWVSGKIDTIEDLHTKYDNLLQYGIIALINIIENYIAPYNRDHERPNDIRKMEPWEGGWQYPGELLFADKSLRALLSLIENFDSHHNELRSMSSVFADKFKRLCIKMQSWDSCSKFMKEIMQDFTLDNLAPNPVTQLDLSYQMEVLTNIVKGEVHDLKMLPYREPFSQFMANMEAKNYILISPERLIIPDHWVMYNFGDVVSDVLLKNLNSVISKEQGKWYYFKQVLELSDSKIHKFIKKCQELYSLLADLGLGSNNNDFWSYKQSLEICVNQKVKFDILSVQKDFQSQPDKFGLTLNALNICKNIIHIKNSQLSLVTLINEFQELHKIIKANELLLGTLIKKLPEVHEDIKTNEIIEKILFGLIKKCTDIDNNFYKDFLSNLLQTMDKTNPRYFALEQIKPEYNSQSLASKCRTSDIIDYTLSNCDRLSHKISTLLEAANFDISNLDASYRQLTFQLLGDIAKDVGIVGVLANEQYADQI